MIPLSTLQSRIRTRYESGSGGSTVRFSDANLQTYINEGLECLAEATGFYERYCTIPVEANRVYYDVRGFTPETVVSIKSVWGSGYNDWLHPANPELLDPVWEQSVTGTALRFWVRGIYWIAAHPISSESTGYMRVRFAGIPPRFSFAQAVLGDLPDNHYPALEDYALYEMAGADRQPKRAISYFQSYKKREKALATFVDHRLSESTIGRIGRFGGR